MTQQPDAPILRAGRHKPSIALFIVIAAFIVAADLTSKHLAFRHVADSSLHLARDPQDGTTMVQVRGEDGNLVPLQRMRPGDPASAIPQHDGVTVVPYLLHLKLTINTGAVFGMGKGAQPLFIAVSVLAVLFIGLVFYRSAASAKLLQICLALILGGAIGNLYDRVLYNGVRDMCHLFPGVKLPFGWTWRGGSDELYPWIFNIADAALVIGVFVLLILTWRGEKRDDTDDTSGKPPSNAATGG